MDKLNETTNKGSVKLQIANGFIFFGFLMICVLVMSFIRVIEIKSGFLVNFLVIFLVFWPYYLIIKKRKEKLNSTNNYL